MDDLQRSAPITTKVAIGFILLCLTALAAYYLYLNGSSYRAESVNEAGLHIAAQVHAGDFDGAMQDFLVAEKERGAAPDKYALAVRDMATIVNMSASSTPEDFIQSVRLLKDTVADMRVSTEVRAENMNVIAESYSRSGSSKTVFDEIFSGEPYKSSLKPNSAEEVSIRNLYRISVDIYPTARAWANIARLNVSMLLRNPDTSTSQRQNLPTHAREAVEMAKVAYSQEVASDPTYSVSARHADYLYRISYATGGLAELYGEPYASQYRAGFEDAINILSSSESVVMKEFLPITRWYYAAFLLRVDNDSDKARSEISELLDEVRAYPSKAFTSLIARSQAELNQGSDRFLGATYERMLATSPELRAYVENL